jgi:hypothetical protein
VNHKQRFEDIYDLLKGLTVPSKPTTHWQELGKQFSNDAKKNLRKFIGTKEMIWSGDTNEIKIGRDFIIKLVRRDKD